MFRRHISLPSSELRLPHALSWFLAYSTSRQLRWSRVVPPKRQLVSADCTELYTRRQKTSWPESASELDRPSDRRLSAKLVPTLSDRGCHVVGVMDHYGRILGFLDRSRYFFFSFSFYPRRYITIFTKGSLS
jgi:hypothetical protein